VIWYGTPPGGGVFLHPYGLQYAPLKLLVNSAGRLMLFGNWKNWPTIAGHEGFAPLAELLGQNHLGGSRSVRAADFDRDVVWEVVLGCAEAINGEEQGAADHS